MDVIDLHNSLHYYFFHNRIVEVSNNNEYWALTLLDNILFCGVCFHQFHHEQLISPRVRQHEYTRISDTKMLIMQSK